MPQRSKSEHLQIFIIMVITFLSLIIIGFACRTPTIIPGAAVMLALTIAAYRRYKSAP